jgi:RNA polymerase sigma-70 factor (ECF subfamily)
VIHSLRAVPARAASLSDDAVIAGVAVGDAAAVQECISRFQRKVYGAALSIVHDTQLADEITQDSFVRLWRHAAGFDPLRGSVQAWLMRIVHNLCVDALRVRRPAAVDPFSLFGLVDGAPDPQLASDSLQLIRRACVGVPPEQVRSVLLAAVYGYSAQQISEQDGIPLGTAKTRIRLGLEKLRTGLALQQEESR